MFWISKIYKSVLGTLFVIYASRNEDIFVDVQAYLKFLARLSAGFRRGPGPEPPPCSCV